MKLSPLVALLVAATLTAVEFLQSELSMSHTAHVIIGAVLVFAAALGISTVKTGSTL